jgi:hypothetical protein
MLAYYIAPSFFEFDPSGRTLAQKLRQQNIPVSKLAVGWMSRGLNYSLNFYLHEEIKSWNEKNLGQEYVLTDVHGCRNLTPVPFACEPMPFDEQTTGVFLYHIVMPGSVQRLSSGGESHKKE